MLHVILLLILSTFIYYTRVSSGLLSLNEQLVKCVYISYNSTGMFHCVYHSVVFAIKFPFQMHIYNI